MRKSLRAVVLAVAVSSGGCNAGGSGASSASSAASGPLSDWKAQDVAGLFTILLPNEARRREGTTPDPKEPEKTLKTVTISAKPPSGYPEIGINVVEMPEGRKLNAKAAFEGARDQGVAAMKGTLLEDKPVSLEEYEGHEFTYTAPGPTGTVRARNRIYVIGQNLVTIIAVAPEANLDDAVVNAFYDSIALVR